MNVGKVDDPKYCKRVADYFERPYYVTLPVNTNDPIPKEHLCFVGGRRSRSDGREPSYHPVSSDVSGGISIADVSSLSNVDYSYGGPQGLNRQNCRAPNGEIVRCLPKLNEYTKPKTRVVEDHRQCCSCEKPIGYMTLVSPQPFTHHSNTTTAVVKTPPELLNLYAAVKNEPWELRKRFTYYTLVNSVRIPVYRGAYNCLRVGCEEIFTGENIDIREVHGHKSILYKVTMYV